MMKTINDVKSFLGSLIGEESSKDFMLKVKTLCKEAKVRFVAHKHLPEEFREYLHKASISLIKDTFRTVIGGNSEEFESFDLYVAEWLEHNGKSDVAINIKNGIKKCITIVYHSIYKTCATYGETSVIDNKRSYHLNATINRANEKRLIQQKIDDIIEKLPNLTPAEHAEYLKLINKLAELS